MASPYLTLKDMTGGSGCTPRTVRYYERKRLLTAARSAGGHRLFDASQLERLNYIIGLREAGWTLEEVETLLHTRDVSSSDGEAARSLESLLSSHIERLERKIALLSELRIDLSGTHRLLKICQGCAERDTRVECRACDQVPPLDQLPHGFRLTWRSKELTAEPYDEPAADIEDPDSGSESSLESRTPAAAVGSKSTGEA
ncbi:MAG: MerR family transcriptional regulator [Nannocystaceae bacterium]|nr:MerR family transcriptional regulator [Nannocystaceae bacterium]